MGLLASASASATGAATAAVTRAAMVVKNFMLKGVGKIVRVSVSRSAGISC